MDGETIANIASESPEIRNERAQLELQQNMLRKGLAACRNALSGSGVGIFPGERGFFARLSNPPHLYGTNLWPFSF